MSVSDHIFPMNQTWSLNYVFLSWILFEHIKRRFCLYRLLIIRSVVFDFLQRHGLYSTPGFPVHHQLPELTQTHVHWVSDAIQSSHPLLYPSPRWWSIKRASLVAQLIKSLPAVQETWVESLGQEDSLEKEVATHSSILAWRVPWTEEPSSLQSMGLQRVSHYWVMSTFTLFPSIKI